MGVEIETKTKSTVSKSPESTRRFAAAFARSLRGPALILLRGSLGAGKTEWARGFVRALLGPSTIVTSPSYSLMNAYSKGKKKIFHVDLYRLRNIDDLESTGFWDLLDGNSTVVVEWGEMLPPQWPKSLKVYLVSMELLANGNRRLEINLVS